MARRTHVRTPAAAIPAALLLLLAASPARAATAAETDRALAGRIDAYAGPLVARGDLSGQLLVARRGRVVLERSWGFADRELGVPVRPDTRFNIASVTKPMTAMIAIELITEGRMRLEDSIARWLPDFPRGDSIRVTHLLRHRSGIPHEVIPDSEQTRPFRAAEVAERAKRLPLDFAPGTSESYSSGGYEVLARILELASGRTYDELLAERVFRRANMTRSGSFDSRAIIPGRASAYVPGPGGFENAPLEDFTALVGAGSVWSTARDVHALVEAVAGGRMMPGARESWVRNGRLEFNGRTGGFKAWALWDSAGGTAAVFLGNASTGAPDALRRDVLRLVGGERVAPPTLPARRATPLADAELRRWEGDYRIEHGPFLRMRVHDGALWSNDWVMWPAADGSMFSPRDYGVVRAVTAPDGSVASLDWLQGTEHYPAPRVRSGR